jgi:acetoin:2,6-dichlorophenolindophenol oxidoreductase subunit alpha
MECASERLLDMYRQMVTIRQFETKVYELFAEKRLPGYVHSYIGEEAIAVGACANSRPGDYLTSTHRGHGHLIAKGGELRLMMAELFGKRTGYCKGKGGSMHLADLDLGILGANGIVGAGIPIAAGAAFAAKYRGTDQVVFCFFGDGASNQSAFHEGINLAAAWSLPVVFVTENNEYGRSTHRRKVMRIADISMRASSYGIPGVTVDGNDVMAVYEVCHAAVARARAGDGPSLVECKTYRLRGHYEGAPLTWRPEEEVAEWRKPEKDPLPRFRKFLLHSDILDQAKVKQIDEEVAAKLDEAIQFAEESPFPDPSELLEDVYTL